MIPCYSNMLQVTKRYFLKFNNIRFNSWNVLCVMRGHFSVSSYNAKIVMYGNYTINKMVKYSPVINVFKMPLKIWIMYKDWIQELKDGSLYGSISVYLSVFVLKKASRNDCFAYSFFCRSICLQQNTISLITTLQLTGAFGIWVIFSYNIHGIADFINPLKPNGYYLYYLL
jgi:hypothetical protein